MITNNTFLIQDIKSVVFLGESKKLRELIEVNDSLKLNSYVITTSDQMKMIDEDIKVCVFDDLNEEFKKLIKKKCNINKTLFISLGARYIFNNDMIDNLFSNNLINLHETRLPLDAGGADFSWNIMREDRINNLLFHIVNEEIDAGPIIYNELSLFPSSCKIPIDFMSYRESKLINFYKNFITKLSNGFKFELTQQSDYLGRYNPRLNTIQNGLIDWSYKPYDLINFINAFDEPYQGSSTYLNRGDYGRIFIKKAQLHAGDSSNHPFMAGIVTRHDKNWIVVSTSGKHMLLIEKVLTQKNENILSNIKQGDRFFTPTDELDKARGTKVIYTPKGVKT